MMLTNFDNPSFSSRRPPNGRQKHNHNPAINNCCSCSDSWNVFKFGI